MIDPIERKKQEESRLTASLAEKNLEIEKKTKEVAAATELAIKTLEKIKNLVLGAQEEYTEFLKSTGKIYKA